MQLKFIIPLMLSLALFVGCSGKPEPKSFSSEVDPYAYVKEYMRWYIHEQMEEQDIVGLSVALVDDQKIVWQEGFGYADKVKKIKATPQTRYRAGSITKLFTAMATMKLVEEGKIDIDKPFKTYLPKFQIKSRFGSTDDITPRTIMSHHSGLPSEWVDRMFCPNPMMYTEHVEAIKNEYVAYVPNTIFSYSNLAVTLLGDAVEKVSAIPYSRYVSKNLLTPLAMNHSDLQITLTGENASQSYGDGKEIIEYADGQVPAGALNTTVGDLSHLIMMINGEGQYAHKTVLQKETLKKMFTVQNKNIALDLDTKIGLGYFIDTKLLGEDEPVYAHGGAMIGHRAYVAVTPKSKLGVVIMSNSSSTPVRKISETFLKKVWEVKTSQKVPKRETTVEVKEDSDFEGLFATIIGKVKIEKDGENEYITTIEDEDFILSKNDKNLYKVRYKLFGLISLDNEDLAKIAFYTKDIEGKHVIVMVEEGQENIVGLRVEPYPIPKKWKSYLGHYKVENNFFEEKWKIDDVEFVIEKGCLLVKQTYASGESSISIIRPLNNTEALVEGLGRSRQETIYYKDGVFHHQGLRFRRMKEK